MPIGAMQKTTLLDYPGAVACTLFWQGCNLRCPFCHNPSLVLPQRHGSVTISPEDLFAFLAKRVGKLDGVCLSGGEPTLDPELPALIRRIRSMGFSVKLDTNGTTPAVLGALLQEGLLDYVAMDIKNSPEKYAQTCGGMDVLDRVRESIRLLTGSGIDHEFRTTVCHGLHTPEDLVRIGQWLSGSSAYYLQPFVDSGDLVGGGLTPPSPQELEELHRAVLPYIPNTHIRGI